MTAAVLDPVTTTLADEPLHTNKSLDDPTWVICSIRIYIALKLSHQALIFHLEPRVVTVTADATVAPSHNTGTRARGNNHGEDVRTCIDLLKFTLARFSSLPCDRVLTILLL